MAKEKIELTLQDESGQEYVAYPFVESEDVTLSNGMDIETMIAQDVSMPIVTHEETSFKVGVGDSDISNSIVDSSVANMTIKGQTYQNILPDPTLRNSMTSGKTMQKINEGYDNVNVVDGIGKNVVLDGQTLVNGITSFTKYSPTTAGNTKTTVVSTSHYIFDFSQNEAQDKGKVLIYMFGGGFKENAQYTVDYWIYENTMTRTDVDKGNVAKINLNSYNTGFVYVTEGEVGHFTKQITTPSVSTQTGSGYIETFTTCIGKLDIAVVIREGNDLEPLEKHFEGMASVKAPTVTTVGKNLFNPFLHKTLTINSNGTFTLQNADWTKTVKYRLKSNTTYTIKLTNPSTSWVCLKINDTTYSHNLGDSTLEKQFTTDSSGEVEVGVFANTPSNIGHTVATIQLEESPTATTYEPHKSTTLEILGATNLIVDSEANKYYTWDAGIADTSAGTKYCSYRAIVEGLSEVYVKNTHSNYTFWDANMGYISGIPFINGSITTGQPEKDGVIKVPSNAKYLRFAYHTVENRGLPHVGEEIALRSLPNGVYDTLNLVTGEYVQRIGEVVLDGSEGWSLDTTTPASENTLLFFTSGNYAGFKPLPNYGDREIGILCDKFKVMPNAYHIDEESMMVNQEARVYIRIAKSKLSTQDVSGFKTWLQSNNVKVSALLNTPITKTVDLSSFGNWDKVILDGAKNWSAFPNQVNNDIYLYQLWVDEIGNANNRVNVIIDNDKFTSLSADTAWFGNGKEGVSYGNANNNGVLQLRIKIASVEKLNEYLSNNPITVWVQKSNTQSYRTKEMLSFSNGHIQLSSNEENSLIPSIKYEVPTNNSYYLDLAKNNTKYTMKNMSGTFTIDGTQYSASANGTFTTPSSMTDKLMITSVAQNEAMIIEGDVTGKDMSYFKGIKSAFEDEDKIEVLSTGKNLIDETLWTKSIIEDGVECLYGDGWYSSSGSVGTPILIPVDIKQGKRYRISVTHKATTHFNNYKILQDCLNNRIVGGAQSVCILDRLNTFTESNASFVANFDAKYLIVDTGNPRCYGYIKKGTLIIEEVEGNENTISYEPYKSNTTKIPLLSSLRSLPSGVYDEVILDRENHKAKIIQRVGKATVVAPQVSEWYIDNNGVANVSRIRLKINSLGARKSQKQMISNLVPVTGRGFNFDEETTYIDDAQNYWLWLHVSNNRLSTPTIEGFKSWLSQNPLVTYYELETPIITEVDLEGFPYIYKDGHIFINSEIAPTSEITYSINQQHQIEASNEDLMRHEKKITNLHKLIGTYVNVEYESTLLALNLELK